MSKLLEGNLLRELGIKKFFFVTLKKTGQLFSRIGRSPATMLHHATNATGRIGEACFAVYNHGKAAQRSTFWTRGSITSLILLGPVSVRSQRIYLELLKTVRYFKTPEGCFPRDPHQTKAGMKMNQQMKFLFLFLTKCTIDGKMYFKLKFDSFIDGFVQKTLLVIFSCFQKQSTPGTTWR